MTILDETGQQAPAAPAGAPGALGGASRTRLAMVALAVTAGVVAVAVRPVSDPDAWWNLRAGQLLRQTWQFAGPDPLGAFSSRDFVLTEWAGDLVAALAVGLVGPAAIIVMRALAIVALAVLMLRSARQQADLVPAVIATFVGLFGSLSLGERPMAAGAVLAMITVLAWRASAADLRPRWWLVALSWVWASTHGSWVAGPAIGVITLAGLAADGRLDRRSFARLAGLVGASVLVAGATPVGPRLLLLPLQIHSAAAGLVAEWSYAQTTNPLAVVTALAALALVLGWLRAGRPPEWWKVAHATAAFGLSVSYNRMVPLAACLLVPLLAEGLQALRRAPAPRAGRDERTALVAGVLVALATALALAGPLSRVSRDVPAAFGATLDRLPPGTVLLDHYDVSSWLLLNEPQLRLVIDTRIEVYDPAYVGRYVTALRAQPGWSEFVERTEASWALLPQEAPLAVALRERRGWVGVQSAQGYVLLRRP